ncbi:PAS domain-containing protein [Caldalkalibacillus horti]|uniref:PAS domain S-box-containing protein n=1 Tax=Caldalkalibacillus horti TaxID=77523 RepID=A0ABT9W196_9BACI|nr:PAS domain-containing protein [Bacillus horti]MDQ0167007.1 PAS domain S-box-containing protein [Bacillus horti]
MNQILSNYKVLIEALNYTRAGVLITDPNLEDNPIVYANKGFVDMTGYTLDEILGENCRFLQGLETAASDVDKLRTGIQKKESVFVEILNYKKDGTEFWNSLSVDPLYMEEEDRHYFIGVQRDVTERKLVEEKYKKSVAEVKALACPIVPLVNDVAVIPLVGEMSDQRFETVFNEASDYIVKTQTKTLILDVSGLTKLTNYDIEGIVKLEAVLSLVGAEMYLTGLSSEMAVNAVQLNDRFATEIKAASSLKVLLEKLI